MISNERPSPYGNRFFNRPLSPAMPHQPRADEDTLIKKKVQIERKTFHFTLKENPRGRFLRITEEAAGRRDSVIIPAHGLEEFQNVLGEIIKAGRENQANASR